ncbi:hypothetical protein AUP40_04535 [Thalassospira xiamenensis]|uniref:Phage protein Gp37/Gp68 n=2 Tax=Thalassospira xiamenensis TaxID=220697 RepID=A0ABR5XXR9_9PROT|nr:hypothetical protein AUP40_04535 [Thalassospira xiamenensis]
MKGTIMTKIEWTQRPGTKGETWNPIRARNKATGGTGHFCTKVSAGCQNCYAADFQKRFKNPVRYAAQDADQVEIFLDAIVVRQPLMWKKPRTIFVCSMTDLFYEGHCDEWIDDIFAIAALCPQHTFIVLTKRIEATRQYMTSIDNNDGGRLEGFRDAMIEGAAQRIHFERTREDPSMWLAVHLPLPNVWIGTSAEDQATAIERIPTLLTTPAAVRFISAEPLLGPVELDNLIIADLPTGEWSFNCLDNEGLDIEDDEAFKGATIDWVICGGESGHKARTMHPDWARSLRDQCKAASVPFFFKQWGAWLPWESADAPFWLSQNDAYVDGHNLFPSEMESDPNWNDGLSFVSDGESHAVFQKVGKKAAGRLLDGVEHNAFPTVSANENRTAESELVKSGTFAA